MDGLGPTAPRYVEYLVEVQIRLAGGRWTDVVCVVGLAHMQGLAVHVGEDGDRLDAHLATGTNDADGDLAAVGYENALEHENAVSAKLSYAVRGDLLRHTTKVAPKQELYCIVPERPVMLSQTSVTGGVSRKTPLPKEGRFLSAS